MLLQTEIEELDNVQTLNVLYHLDALGIMGDSKKIDDYLNKYVNEVNECNKLVKQWQKLYGAVRCNGLSISGNYCVHSSGLDCPLHGPCTNKGRIRAYIRKSDFFTIAQAMDNEKKFHQVKYSLDVQIERVNRIRSNFLLPYWYPENYKGDKS